MEPTCSYFELLDKENSLSFDLSLLDCIPLNEDDNLDSVEATICFLTDGIQKKSRRKLNTLRPQKWKISRRANISLLHFLRNRLNLFPFFVPRKTSDSTKWATRIFADWCSERNGCPSALLSCPTNLFEHAEVSKDTGCHYGYPLSTLDFWLAAFVTEVHKTDGGYYSPASLNCILAGLFRHMKDRFVPNTPNFLSKTEAKFTMFQNSLDRQLRFLRGNGVGVERNMQASLQLRMKISCGHLEFWGFTILWPC